MSPSLTVEVEAHAELPKLVGGLWHPYRRKWATERKHHALVDVAAASGWRDTRTLLTCYQQPDVDAMLAAMSEPRKVRDSAMITRDERAADDASGVVLTGPRRVSI